MIGSLPRVPRVPRSAERGVYAVLRRRNDTCLVQSIVRQAWNEAQGIPSELVIGVTSPAGGLRAHAWLEGDEMPHGEAFSEIARRSSGSSARA